MAHCPQCGFPSLEGARACTQCGTILVREAAPPKAARTMVGVSAEELLPTLRRPEAPAPGPAPAAGAPSPAAKTIVGLSAGALGPMPRLAQGAPEVVAPSPANRTMVGVAPPAAALAANAASAQTLVGGHALGGGPVSVPDPASRTLLGVARPGIAPLAPGVEPEPDESYAPASELGATVMPVGGVLRAQPRQGQAPRLAQKNRPRVELPKSSTRSSGRVLLLSLAAGGLAIIAVLVALLWPAAKPLTARARADASGKEGVELTCASCPDGTHATIDVAAASFTNHVAIVPLAAALSVGENRLKVDLERPSGGRRETVNVVVNVAYRIRPDLATLQGEKPSIQIVAEAAAGTTISIDGKPMTLANGRGTETIDVLDAISGLSDDSKTLSRQVPYEVKLSDGSSEHGAVSVAVGIVPLHIDAPGPRVTIDGSSFVLAGRTLKGAEVLAAGRPITVRPDGTFAQVMNVSAVGATQIEVRSRISGMAPRLTQIGVRRVESLDAAAKDFAAQATLTYPALAANIAANVGKPIVLGGEVVEARRVGYQTVILLDVAREFGCPTDHKAGSCPVRLVQGAENPSKPGDALRAYGTVARAFAYPGKGDAPEIAVELTLKGLK